MSDLSIFIDESGDLGETSNYYLISLIFHDQDDEITNQIKRYENALAQRGLPDTPLHLGPLLNGHDEYEALTLEQRRKALGAFRTFVQNLPVSYFCFRYKKSQFGQDRNKLTERMKRDLTMELFNQLDFFQQFDNVKIYYDNGQPVVTEVIHTALEYVLVKNVVVYRDASPRSYRLFQIADYVCTVELTSIKFDKHEETRTDKLFFGTRRTFEKGYLRYLRKKCLQKVKHS